MSDSNPLFELAVAAVSAAVSGAFSAGVMWASLKSSVKAAREEAATALQQAQTALERIAAEKERSSRQQGQIDGCNKDIGYMRRDVDEMRPVVFKSRFDSDRGMTAVRAPQAPARDERRDDTDPPPMRTRLPSRRDT